MTRSRPATPKASASPRTNRVALWLVVLAPAAVLPGGFDRFVLASALVAGVALAVGLGARPTGRLPRWALAGLAVGTAVLVVDALLSDQPLAELWGRWPRYEGLLTLPAAAGALWLGARLLGPKASRRAADDLERAVVVLVALVGLVAILEAFGLRPLASSSARPGSLLGNATDQGVVGLLGTTVLLAPAVRRLLSPASRPAVPQAPAPRPHASRSIVSRPPAQERRPLAIDLPGVRYGAAALGAVTVVLSGSRGAIAGLLVALVVTGAATVLVGPRTTSPRNALLATAAACVAVGALALALPATSARVLGTSPLSGATVEGRALLWSDTWRLVLAHPWAGVGPSGFVDAIPALHTTRWALQVGPQDPPDSPHSWPLQAAAVGGFPLLVVAAGLVVVGFVVGMRRLRAAVVAHDEPAARPLGGDDDRAGRVALLVVALGALAGYVVVLATHVTSPQTTVPAALLAGALVAREPAAARAATWWRTGGAVVVGAWLVVLVLATAAEWPLRHAYDAATSSAAGASAEADHAFAAAQDLRPWDADVAMLASQAFAARALAGDDTAAGPAARWSARALARLPHSSTAIAASSAAAEVSGDYARADDLMSRLVAADPTNAEWLLRRGVIRAEREDLPGAEADLVAASVLAPTSPEPWRDLATVYQLMGDDRKAADAQDRVKQLGG